MVAEMRKLGWYSAACRLSLEKKKESVDCGCISSSGDEEKQIVLPGIQFHALRNRRDYLLQRTFECASANGRGKLSARRGEL
jgi:hypothetical protein